MKAQTKDIQTSLTPQAVLQLLKDGNQRFTSNSQHKRDLLDQVKSTSTGQFPSAVVLSCIDSRVPAETVLDQGIGDIFSIRIAGNFINEDILGSMEFACKVAGSKLILVLGHSSCGAVKGACDHVELGNLTSMLSKIKPAVEAVNETKDRSSGNSSFVQSVADKNVEMAIEQIKKQSPVLNEMLDNGEIGIAGAMYSVETGAVTFN